MKKFKFIVFVLLVSLFTLTLVACNGDKDKTLEYTEGTELKLAVAHNSKATTITFQDGDITGSGLTLADGVTYQTDDLKPVWKELEKRLNVTFNNVYAGNTSVQNEYRHWKTQNFEGVDVVVGNADEMASDGKTGQIVNLAEYLDYMPNFKRFLEENPIVYLSVISDVNTGAIYYAPYFDGYDDIEKYYLMRTDWLEKLLDGEGDFTADQSDKFGDIVGEAVYEPYMPTSGKLEIESLKADGSGTEVITKNYDTTYGNIIEYMNENVDANTTGVELVNMFRKYIDAAYNGYYGTNRSQLFAGNNACWDADELVALLRCVVTNTFALTGQNEDKVTGLFPREAKLNRTSDLFSLVSLFGVRGYESRNDYLYFDAQGNLRDARADVEFAEAIDKLNQLYKEKLILQDFDTTEDTIYKVMYQQNKGFMIYDYCQTQTLYNNDATTLAKEKNFNLAPIINPVAKWFDGTNVKNGKDEGVWMRFTESWRSVKTNGWCIPTTCTGEALNAAIALFDYMYSEEGNILMSFGPDAWRSGNTIPYKGEQIPELSEAALNELWELAGGNYTNYARQYLGSTLPVGFVKNQGMEYQCTTEGGRKGAEVVSNAIAHGVLKHVSPEISDNLFYTMVPTVLPTTAEEDLLISGFAALGSSGLYSKSKDRYNIYTEVLKNGFGSKVALNNTFITTMPDSAQALVAEYKELGGNAYIVVRQSAWVKLENYYRNNIVE
jgi:hypothetical protein